MKRDNAPRAKCHRCAAPFTRCRCVRQNGNRRPTPATGSRQPPHVVRQPKRRTIRYANAQAVR